MEETPQESKRCILTTCFELEERMDQLDEERRSQIFASALSKVPNMLRTSPPLSHERANLLHIQARLLFFAEDSGPQKSLEVMKEAVSCGVAAGGGEGKFKRVAQLKREEHLREIMLSLGLVDLEKERLEEEAKQKKRDDRAAHHKRSRERKRTRENASLRKLGSAINELHDKYFTPEICGAPGGPGRITWDDIPHVLQPSSTSEGGLTTNLEERVKRKQWQLESLAFALKRILLRVPPPPPPPPASSSRRTKVVDFGSGSGNSSLVLAHLNPSIDFTLIDTKPECISIIKSRCESANITNVTAKLISCNDFKEEFDVGLGVHLCGEGTDEAVVKCFDKQASFLIVPCCLGKISKVVVKGLDNLDLSDQYSAVDYPRSQWLKGELELESYLRYTRLGDYSDGNGEGGSNVDAVLAKRLIDVDRGKVAEEKGYDLSIGKYHPLEASVKNDVICGISPNHNA